jgi:hypothetical protein
LEIVEITLEVGLESRVHRESQDGQERPDALEYLEDRAFPAGNNL